MTWRPTIAVIAALTASLLAIVPAAAERLVAFEQEIERAIRAGEMRIISAPARDRAK